MSKPTIVDEQKLDDLVTGNLRGEEYRQLLQAIDARPYLWRQCALAFLREQALQQDMQALMRGQMDWTQASGSSPGNQVELASMTRPDTEAPHQLRNWTQRLATLAALLLVSFSVGWLGAGLRLDDGGPGGATSNQAGMLGIGESTLGSSATGRSNAAPSPIGNYGSSVLLNEQISPLDFDIPPELRQLEEMGYVTIESFDAIMPITLPDGASAIVPVRQLRVTPELYSY